MSMFNKSSLFNKREEEENAHKPTTAAPSPGSSPASSTSPSIARPTPTPRPGTFGANMRSQSESNSFTDRNKQDKQQQDVQENSGNRLIVGPSVKLRGAEILDCDTLVVEGRVEATMDSRVIRIADKGTFSGKVGVDVAEIHGNFEGELTARKQLVIHATGVVSGSIRYGTILIEEGGVLSGDVQSLNSAKGDKLNAKKEEDKVKPFVANN